MKTIDNFCKVNNLQSVSIRYKHQFGCCKRKGYDVVNPSNNAILVSFEPVYYSNGDKYHLRNVHHNYTGLRYCKRITTKFLENNINVNETSFFRLA